MTFDLDTMGQEFDWDNFLVDMDLPVSHSPAPSDDLSATPKSTESEQSLALDVNDPDPEFDIFNMLPSGGIIHNPTDIFHSIPNFNSIPIPDHRGSTDPTMTGTFGLDFGDFGSITGLGNDAAAQLGLTDLIEKLVSVGPPPSVDINHASLAESYSALGWLQATPQVTAVEPAQLVTTTSSPPPSLKRKESEDSSFESLQTLNKKPRGRPPKSRADSQSAIVPPPTTKRPYRRQSKNSPVSGSPLARSVTFPDDMEDNLSDTESTDGNPPKLTVSGKPSTARPKSVVPEKYFKDGSAQAILGMHVDEILAFPTFEELLKKVSPHLREGAKEFGEKIKENRDKAKDAAKKSRDERRQKIDSLEQTVLELEIKVDGMRGVLMALVGKGVLSSGEVSMWI